MSDNKHEIIGSPEEEVDIGEFLQAMSGEGAPSKDTSPQDYIKENLLILKTKGLESLTLDKKEFQAGINDVSRMLGAISAFVSIGVNPNKAMDYLTDKEATADMLKHNLDLANITTKAQVEAARCEQRQIKSQQI